MFIVGAKYTTLETSRVNGAAMSGAELIPSIQNAAVCDIRPIVKANA